MGFRDLFKFGGKGKAQAQVEPELVTVYDERGRELKVEREVWARDILLPTIRTAWDDADRLYSLVVGALQDSLAREVMNAAARLVDIDGASERSLVLDAIVHLRVGDLKGAEERLERSAEQHGRTGVMLTNLAKVQDERGEQERSRATLRQALEADPNQDNGLMWWVALARDRGGEAAYQLALEEIARLPGAWRPQLWIARQHLERQEIAAALALYHQVLAVAEQEPGVLMMVSGDLGRAGALREMVELISPRYAPEQHGVEAGMNLARALMGLGQSSAARAVVRRLHPVAGPGFAQHVAELEREIAEAALPEAASEQPQVGAMAINGPLWARGLFEPKWLFRERGEQAPQLTFFMLTTELVGPATQQVQSSNDVGRATRALPLYLAEVFGLTYGARAGAMLFVVPGTGPAVFGHELELERIAGLVEPHPGPQLVVLGSVIEGGARVDVWDLKAKTRVSSHRAVGGLQELGELASNLVHVLATELTARRLIEPAKPPPCYRLPPDGLRSGYVLALEQLLYQVLAANDVVKPESIWNERGFFETELEVVESWNDAPDSARLIVVCAVMAAHKYGSSLVAPYRKLVLGWFDKAEPRSTLDRIAPAVFKRLGEDDRFAHWLRRDVRSETPEYQAWLERVRQG